MSQALQKLLRDENGQGLAEYGLILSFIAVVCVGATKTFGQSVTTMLANAGNSLAP